MYYIINQKDQVIAADDRLLRILRVENIDDLTKQLILGDITIDLTEENVSLSTSYETLSYTIQSSPLSSILGAFKLIHLLAPTTDTTKSTTHAIDEESDFIEKSIPNNEIAEDISIEEPLTCNDEIDNLILIKDSTPSNTTSIYSHDEEISFLDDQTPSITDTKTPDTHVIEEDALFDLTIPNAPQETIEEISLEPTIESEDSLHAEDTKVAITPDTTPIVIDVSEVSKNIGISIDDYNAFLDEYIDTAISLEEDLQSNDQSILFSATNTLMQLADVLELPSVNGIIDKLNQDISGDNKHIVETFYATLSRLTTYNDTPTMHTFAQNDSSEEKEVLTLEDPKMETETTDAKGFGSISLKDIKPIHFDFRLEEAANDLSLPVELIEEFVHDFIVQAHEETEKMLLAYKEGDLKTIQQIGHMLKGASSNLRINALSDTLYEIQFCEDSTMMEDFIKRYWAHFLSFEQQIDILSK
jgi:HPt (histidine-containing phosphotransfer) domain-containing protein